MATMDDEGVKFGGTYWPFTYDDGCAGCRFAERVGTVEGLAVDRDICKMTPEDEDRFLFENVAEDKIPPCMKD